MATKTFPIHVAIDENGDVTIHLERDELISDHLYEHGESGTVAISTINVTMPIPEGAEVDVTIPESATEVVTAEVAS